jgi:hypothetical protein
MTRSALLTLLVASLFLTGCETVNEWMEPSPEAPPALEQNLAQPYLDMLSQLVTGDAGQQEAIFERTHGDWLADPSDPKLLAYALVLATPGHAHSDAQAAQTHFSQLLANPEALAPEELEITRVFMAYAQQWQRLVVERNDLSGELAKVKESSQEARDTQMRELRGQLNTLREQLKDAESKLDAIANIEREMERLEPERN